MSIEVLDFINKYIEEVDPTYKQERILYKDPVKDETDFLIQRNKERTISKDNKVELERLLESIN